MAKNNNRVHFLKREFVYSKGTKKYHTSSCSSLLHHLFLSASGVSLSCTTTTEQRFTKQRCPENKRDLALMGFQRVEITTVPPLVSTNKSNNVLRNDACYARAPMKHLHATGKGKAPAEIIGRAFLIERPQV